LEQTLGAGTGKPTVTPLSILNGLAAAGFPNSSYMPLFSLVLLGKPKPRQCAESSCRLYEIELRLYRDFSLGVFAMSERDQAGCLRLG
jgi:hypothetical protein